jgi:hypothetical protein
MRPILIFYIAHLLTWFVVLTLFVSNPLGAAILSAFVAAGSLSVVGNMKPAERNTLTQALCDGRIHKNTLLFFGCLTAIVGLVVGYGLMLVLRSIPDIAWLEAGLFILGGLIVAIVPAIPFACWIDSLHKSGD